MYGFIELTNTDSDRKMAIAIDSIRMISDEGSFCAIRFKGLSGVAFKNGEERFPTGLCFVREPYEEIKRKITEAGLA